jgi:acylpyruvate hydrolase
VRFATLRTSAGPRLHVRRGTAYVDVAQATGDERLATMRGFLESGERALAVVTAADSGGEPVDGELAPALPEPGKILCLGRNYAQHADEMRRDRPAWPEVFLRVPSCVVGPFDDVELPPFSRRADYEGELGVVIGGGGRHIPAERALAAIAGFVVVNDISIRDWQHRGQQWTPGKNFERTFPLGPELVTADEVDPSDLALETRVNGEVVQSGRTSQMIFGIPEQIEFLSSFLTLEPGDLIATGTPGGVGVAREPPRFLKNGDVVEVTVEHLGTIRNRMRSDPRAPVGDHWVRIAEEAVSRG